MVFIMLINVKMTTIVGILTFMSRINFVLRCVEHEKRSITSGPGCFTLIAFLLSNGCMCSVPLPYAVVCHCSIFWKHLHVIFFCKTSAYCQIKIIDHMPTYGINRKKNIPIMFLCLM